MKPATVAGIASALGVDAASIEAPVDPPAPAGDLRADIDQYKSLDACVAERSRLDPLVGDALEALGYDTFLRDACRVLDAAKAKEPKRCEAIDASALRARCAAVVAAFAGDPDACPWEVGSRPLLGRDSTCVAEAAHDPRLCAGAARDACETCAALVWRDPKRCEGLPAAADRGACRRDVQRWAGVLAAPAEGLAPLAKPTAKLVLVPLEGTSPSVERETDVTDAVERGVVLAEGRDGVRFDIGTMREEARGYFAAAPVSRPYASFSIFVPVGTKQARIEQAELGV
ncbi:MAG TPA: hypothetical protein VFF43_21235, partial [Caldimonas sp.]|nr:hypothetical protein [Caldimonas sp.]